MEKKYKLLFLISVVLIILGPVFGLLFDKITLVAQPHIISVTSYADVQNASAHEFTLGKNQKAVIEFSVFTENVTAYLMILSKGDYETEYEASTDPPSISGEKYFIYSQFIYGRTDLSNLASPVNVVSITEEGSAYIEFAGGTSGDYLLYIPGTYVVVVYGTNTGGPHVYFDLVLKVDGPGEMLQYLFVLVGLGVLVATMLLSTLGYLKKTGRGLL